MGAIISRLQGEDGKSVGLSSRGLNTSAKGAECEPDERVRPEWLTITSNCHPSRRRNAEAGSRICFCGAGDLLFGLPEQKQIPRAAKTNLSKL
jgi:hypothetical protein